MEVGQTCSPLEMATPRVKYPTNGGEVRQAPLELQGESKVKSQSLGMPLPVYVPFHPCVYSNCLALTSRLDVACGGEGFSTKFATPAEAQGKILGVGGEFIAGAPL